MRTRLVLLVLLSLVAAGCGTVAGSRAEAADRAADLAARDDVWIDEDASMASYWLAVLRRGPAYSATLTPEVNALLEEHVAYLDALALAGSLAIGGPCGPQPTSDPMLGLLVLRVATRAEAQALADGDPAVAAGRLRVELVPWWAPKGITFEGLHHGPRPAAGDDEVVPDSDASDVEEFEHESSADEGETLEGADEDG